MQRHTQTDLSQTTFDELDSALDHLDTILHDFAGLSARDRQRIRTVGQRSEAFVFRALETGKQNADLLPRGLDLIRLEQDQHAREALVVRLARLEQACEKVRNTLHLLGADVMQDSLGIYAALKRFGANEGLEEALAMMKDRFKR